MQLVVFKFVDSNVIRLVFFGPFRNEYRHACIKQDTVLMWWSQYMALLNFDRQIWISHFLVNEINSSLQVYWFSVITMIHSLNHHVKLVCTFSIKTLSTSLKFILRVMVCAFFCRIALCLFIRVRWRGLTRRWYGVIRRGWRMMCGFIGVLVVLCCCFLCREFEV